MRIQTFYRTDGTEFRVRADVTTPMITYTGMDWADVVVANHQAARKFRPGDMWGLGRFAPVRTIKIYAA